MDLPLPIWDTLPAPKWDRPALVAKTDPVPVKLVKVAAAGYHVHRCPHDGFEWSHTDRSYGIQADHTCPLCGVVVWQVYQNGTRIVERKAASYPGIPDNSTAADCPPGGT